MRLIITVLLIVVISACSRPAPLSPGLSARMDIDGAQLNRQASIAIINDLRSKNGLMALSLSNELNEKAQRLAQIYAQGDAIPKKPANVSALRASAGYVNFAQTFSGWRGDPISASALIEPSYRFAGLGVVYLANSNNGTYWILLLDDSLEN